MPVKPLLSLKEILLNYILIYFLEYGWKLYISRFLGFLFDVHEGRRIGGKECWIAEENGRRSHTPKRGIH